MDGNLVTATNVTAAFVNGIFTLGGGVPASNITLGIGLSPTATQNPTNVVPVATANLTNGQFDMTLERF